MTKKDKDDYEVGYKKPPKKNQFKPGQSGNKRGRPKGSKNLDSIYKELFNTKLPNKETGEKMPVSKALVNKLLIKALQDNDIKAIDYLLKQKERLDLKEETKRKLEEKAKNKGKSMLEQFAEFEEMIKDVKLGTPKPPEDLKSKIDDNRSHWDEDDNQEKSA